MSCPFCGKPLLRQPALSMGYHSQCKKRRRKLRLSEDQKTCALRDGMCWANADNPSPCLLGLVMEHTNCKLSQTKELVLLGVSPVYPSDWQTLWQTVTDLSKQEEELLDIIHTAEDNEDEVIPGDYLRVAEIRAKINETMRRVDELRR